MIEQSKTPSDLITVYSFGLANRQFNEYAKNSTTAKLQYNDFVRYMIP